MARPRMYSPEEAKHRQYTAQAKWRRENLQYMNIALPNGKRDLYKKLAEYHGTTVSAMVQDYMDDSYEKTFHRSIEEDRVVK